MLVVTGRKVGHAQMFASFVNRTLSLLKGDKFSVSVTRIGEVCISPEGANEVRKFNLGPPSMPMKGSDIVVGSFKRETLASQAKAIETHITSLKQGNVRFSISLKSNGIGFGTKPFAHTA